MVVDRINDLVGLRGFSNIKANLAFARFRKKELFVITKSSHQGGSRTTALH